MYIILKKRSYRKGMRNLSMYWNEVISEILRWKEKHRGVHTH